MNITRSLLMAGLLATGAASMEAQASLTAFKSFTGQYGVSTDGWGSNSQSGVISASVPAGSTVVAAYLYTSAFSTGAVGGTFNSSVIDYAANLGVNAGILNAWRADVTNLVKPVIDGGAGGIYNFDITESSSYQDGSALVVVYSNGALGVSSIGILDGFSASTGDSTSINFAEPLDPSGVGFKAEMMLGIGFSCCGSQYSTVKVNGQTLTNNAGNNDDGLQVDNGALITVGGFDDPLSPINPSYAEDHERYNLSSFIAKGDTKIVVDTLNPSNDDNIFLAVFNITGVAGFNEPPPPVDQVFAPATFPLVGSMVLLMLGLRRRK